MADFINKFANNLNNLSVFTEDTFPSSVRKVDSTGQTDLGPYGILIEPIKSRIGSDNVDTGVVGVLKNNVSFSLNAEWETLGLDSIIGGMIPFSNVLGNAVRAGDVTFNGGLLSEKYFSKSGYLELSPEFRVIDSNDEGIPTKTAMVLFAMSLPKTSEKTTIREFSTVLNANSPLNKGINFINEKLEGLSKSEFRGIRTVAGAVNEGVNRSVDGDLNLTSSPKPVTVKIGTFMSLDDMVVESVDVNFSREMTKAGPLYADFTVKLSSMRTIVLKKDPEAGLTGINIGVNKNSRVNIRSGNLGAF
jgi:hypothetical protein